MKKLHKIYSVVIMAMTANHTIYAQSQLEPSIIEALADKDLGSDIITEEELENAQASDLDDVFEKSPSVHVNGGKPQAQQIFVNGIESTFSNVTVDGAAQGNFYHHASSVFVEPDLLKRVSVSGGAGSALNGLGALNGAISFETKNAFDLLGEESFYGKTKASYNSNGSGFKLSETLATKLNNNWSLLLAGGYTDEDDYESGDGDTVGNSAYSSRNLLLKLSGRYDEHSLDFGIEHVQNKTLSYDRINVSNEFVEEFAALRGLTLEEYAGLLQDVELGRNTFTLNYRYDPASDLVALKANAYVSDQFFERADSGDRSDLQTLGVDLQNTSRLSDSLTMTYGFNFKSIENDLSYYGVTGDESETAYGIFLQGDWQFTEIASLGFGGRYDSYDYEDVSGQDFDSSKFSPNVSLSVSPMEGFEAKLSYSEAYRGVGIREALLSRALPAGVDGEESETIKLEARYEKEGYFAQASYFEQSIDNYLYPVAGSGSFGDIQNEGYEASVGYRNRNSSITLSVTDNEPSVEGYEFIDDLGLVVAGRRWMLTADYTFENTGFTLGGGVEYRESVDQVELNPAGRFPAIAGKDSYILWNAFVEWDVEAVDGLSIQLNIDNIFDKDYAEHTIYATSGLNSPGRQVTLGASYEF
ncbi:MAG: TonB-dependent receptor domain-containing protein [Akkermansiaceae bacterium]